MWLLVISVVGALAISAFCSLMEAVLLSLRPSQIAELAGRRPKIGALWQGFKADIDRPIAAILILNTAAHTIGAAVAGAEFNSLYGVEWIWAFSLVFTFLMLQFTEIIPKSAGVRYNRQAARVVAWPLSLLVTVLRPVVLVIGWINRPFAPVQVEKSNVRTVEEIAALAGLARLSKQISARQERIIRKGAGLATTKARAVMRSRLEIDALDIDTPPEEVVGAVVMSGFARVPVYEGDLDHIVGFVYIKDVLRQVHMGWPIELKKLLRPAPFVPETLPLDRLLQVFRSQRTQMAVILDEYGGTLGLVTMEDVLEELVGEIHDELRHEDPHEITRRNATTWEAHGSAGLHDLFDLLGRPELLAAAPTDVHTVAGLIQWILDRIPTVGDHAEWNGLEFEVTSMDGVRVQRVVVRTQ